MTTAAVARARRSSAGLLARVLVLSLLCISGQARGPETTPIVFPGKESRNPSPNGLYVVVNVDNVKMTPSHELLIRNMKSGSLTPLLAYPRWVSTLWSPSGSALIVNDHAGSDYANAYVYIFGISPKRVSVVRELKKTLPDDTTLFQNDHVYVEGTQWIDDNTIKVKVYGHGPVNPNGFVRYFEYTLGGGIRELRGAHSSHR